MSTLTISNCTLYTLHSESVNIVLLCTQLDFLTHKHIPNFNHSYNASHLDVKLGRVFSSKIHTKNGHYIDFNETNFSSVRMLSRHTKINCTDFSPKPLL